MISEASNVCVMLHRNGDLTIKIIIFSFKKQENKLEDVVQIIKKVCCYKSECRSQNTPVRIEVLGLLSYLMALEHGLMFR